MDPLELVASGAMEALQAAGVEVALAGGMAANTWVDTSDISPTFDVDIAILVPQSIQISDEAMAARLSERLGMPVLASGELNLRKASIRQFFCVPHELTLDLLVVQEDLARAALGRVGEVQIAGANCPVLAPEDAILFKSLARRAKDIRPINAIARAQKLDMRYVERWARRLGTW